MDREIVEIDGRRFAVRRVPGPHGPALEVHLERGDVVRLAAWTLDAHLAALDRHTDLEGQAPRLDAGALAAALLTRTSDAPLDDDTLAALLPLALWWAGGAAPPARPDPDGGLALSAGRAALRPWTSLARAQALDACTDPHTGALRVGSYLRAMITASVAAPFDPLALAGDDAALLLDAVADLNAPQGSLSDGPGGAELARATLRLCRALGWTPGQVWSAPAAEVDRMLALLDRLEAPAPRPAPPRPAPASRLATFPDAVIIEVGDG